MATRLEGQKPAAIKTDVQMQRRAAEVAGSKAVSRCFQFLQRQRQWINEQHLELCRIAAPTFFEEKRAKWVSGRLKDLGWDSRLDRAGNVVATPGGGKEGPFVALTAHLDTVLAPRQPEDIRLTPAGRFLGPGVSDNGAGLAALLAFAAAWKAEPPVGNPSSLLLVANVGEEGEGNLSGMRFLCKQTPLATQIRQFVVLDGPGLEHITCRALSSRRYEVAITGPGGHSWSDHGTPNPVHALSRAIHNFTETQHLRYNGNAARRTSYNFGTIEGGISVNSIPESARAKVDLRSEEIDRIEDLAKDLVEAVERAVEVENHRALNGRVQAKLREIGSRPGGVLSEQSRLLAQLRAVDGLLGIRSQLDCASTDANIPLSLGIEAISIGAGGQGGGAHTQEEWYEPDGRDLGLQRILVLLCLLLGE